MIYRALGDLTLVIHLTFIVFVAVGGLLAWRWPGVLWVHVPSVIWAVGIITIGFPCPLTPLEKFFRRRGGEEAYAGGFVDRYVEGVVYPEALTGLLRAIAAVAIVAGYVGVARRVAKRLGKRHERGALCREDARHPLRFGDKVGGFRRSGGL